MADSTKDPKLDILCTISTAGAVPAFIAIITVGAVPAVATTFAIGTILARGATIAACAVSTSCAVCVLVRSHHVVKLRPKIRSTNPLRIPIVEYGSTICELKTCLNRETRTR